MMRLSAFGVGLAVVLVLGGTARTRAQDEPTKIVGVWEVTKAGDLPLGSTIEFAKDGKFTVKVKGEKDEVGTGTYAVAKTKLTVKLKFGDASFEQSAEIKKLTATELHLLGDDNKTEEFKRK
ncbi:lipocalin family protein [Urbifossiella limnaea]|uniref:Lipocalin-like domain-containing protein n=1 Tax=Urbifossiella limnaea TaxID=2528023 RepID=A0A517XNH9_9BACT|nr:lipocalin family protein [Urbifossiella limnaea]QDU19061.1 hypothetical protein ETAA1_09640 [Urbifossiella limnaea]